MDEVETLLIDVRAGTQGFAADIARMRGAFDATLVDGFARAGDVLECGLVGAIARGGLGFDDLKRTALATLDQIAAHALRAGIGGLAGGTGGLIGTLLTGLLGLPGRATGGPVAPGRPYMVGERGPELFVPTAAGRVEAGAPASARDVRVSIQLATPAGEAAPVALRRSSRQLASALRRALADG